MTWDTITLGDRVRFKGNMYTFVGYKWFEALSSYLLLLHPLGERSDEGNLYCCASEIQEVFPSPFPTFTAGIQSARFAGHKGKIKTAKCSRYWDGGWYIIFKLKIN